MTMTLVQTVTAGAGGVASITINNIPQTGKDLCLKLNLRGEYAGESLVPYTIRFNNDSNSNYWYKSIRTSNPSGLETFGSTSGTGIQTWGSGAGATSGAFGVAEIKILNYTTSRKKVVFSDSAFTSLVTSGGYIYRLNEFYGFSYRDTTAISSITITSNYADDIAEYSTASLYIIS